MRGAISGGSTGSAARLALGLGLSAAAASASAASFPPELRFQSLATARVTVHFHQGLETMARQAAALADEILAAHEARYGTRVGRVQLVLSDVEDDPNGFALPLPYPLVHVSAAAPDGGEGLGNHEGWLRLVLTHELAHIVHLEQARGLIRFGRKVLGRAPFLFPNLLTPTWMIEGLATYEETQGTAFGRGRDSDARMVLRMAALEGRFPTEDQAVLGLDRWPDGDASYLFGEAFLRDLTERHGEATLPELARVQAGRPIPFLDDLTAKKVTGASFHRRWREWSARLLAEAETESGLLRARGLTETRALTSRGVRQVGPRFSPDGALVAYTSGTLTRLRAIRLVRADGTRDRKLVDRVGGSSLSWTPDGRTLVYDEPEVHRTFAVRGGLRAVDVATGRARWIARGLRASDPDVAPDGARIVFVRRHPDRSELAVVDRDGAGLRDLTTSPAETQWSRPRWSPSGDSLVASRWTPGGWLDLVRVDPRDGSARELTHDRARDLEPSFTPDGRDVVFRSDRDGISNLYALRLADGDLRRLTNVLGGASDPSVSPDGAQVAFASYSSRGYDVHVAALDRAGAPAAEAFADPHPPPRPPPAPAASEVRPYRPLRSLWPRFWSPYAASDGGETRVGALTAGFDPLFRHAYGLVVERGLESERVGVRGFYQYDRFHPTLLLVLEDTTEPAAGPVGRIRTQRATLRATLPVRRSMRSVHSLSLTWRRERSSALDAPLDLAELGGLEAAWAFSSAKSYPFAISPSDGWRMRVAYLQEDPALGGDFSLGRLTADARAYVRLGEGDVLALRAGGGASLGSRLGNIAYAVGGFPEGDVFDLALTNPALLRGYPDDVAVGRKLAYASAEYRRPLFHPQRGWRLFPAFVRHLHASAFVDAAHAWTGPFHAADVRASAGLALGADAFVAHGLPLTGVVGLARGFARDGETQVYFRLGLAF